MTLLPPQPRRKWSAGSLRREFLERCGLGLVWILQLTVATQEGVIPSRDEDAYGI